MGLEVGCWNLLLYCSVPVSQTEGEEAEALTVAAAAAAVVALPPIEGSV